MRWSGAAFPNGVSLPPSTLSHPEGTLGVGQEALQSPISDVKFPHLAEPNLGNFRIGRGVWFVIVLPRLASFEIADGGKILAAGVGFLYSRPWFLGL